VRGRVCCGLPPGAARCRRFEEGRTPERTRDLDVNNFSEKISFIWSVADLLRGDYKQSEYGKVILPFTTLRRLDSVLAATRQAVWDADAKYPKGEALDTDRDNRLLRAAGVVLM
jgi:hypothetical protein